jgi:hypothetical protein
MGIKGHLTLTISVIVYSICDFPKFFMIVFNTNHMDPKTNIILYSRYQYLFSLLNV